MTYPKLPKTIFVTCDYHSAELQGLLAWRDPFDAAEDNVQRVGIYKLHAIKRIRKVVEIKP